MTSLARQFDRAATHYNEAAEPQRLVIDRLVQLLDEHLPKAERHFAHAFEMGTGSGLLTERIDQLAQIDHWTLADLSAALLAQIPSLSDPAPELLVGDASACSLEGRAIDLFVSSSAIQWLPDPRAYLQRVVHEVTPDALLAVSTFGPDNLLELRQLTGQGLDYPTLADWRCTLEELGYAYELRSEQLVIPFANPLAVLNHLRHTGTGMLPGAPQQIRTPRQLKLFMQKYITNFATKDGEVTLTFHPMYIIINKRHQL